MRVGVILLLTVVGLTGAMIFGAAQARDRGRSDDRGILGRTDEIPDLIASGRLRPDQIPNPHWRDDACQACHRGRPGAGAVKLRDASVDRLCGFCHDAEFDHSYIHPVDVKPNTAMRQRMPASYRDALRRGQGEGTMSCVTCHDLPAQCLADRRAERRRNPRFFRGGPFATRSAQCYYCHDARQYERLNPHEQVSAGGELRGATCQLCHSEDIERLQAAPGIEDLRFVGGPDLSSLCTRCHPWVPHPGGNFAFGRKRAPAEHLVKPPEKIVRRMQQRAAQSGLTLPLEPGTGKVFCATCHEPHAAGVIAGRQAGSEVKHRLRAAELCLRCHDK